MTFPETKSLVGIDAISFATPRAYVDLVDLATARGVPPEKLTQGLGALRMSIADRHEDPVTLAVDAASAMFDRADVDPSQIGFCAVGTESGIDHSKPVASYVHGLLELPSRCRVYDAKHACFGGTAALMAACEWIASGAARGRTALVICSDIARYEIGSKGEPTQGAGAVAMLIAERPRLLEIEVGRSGGHAADVHDFWRPLHRRDALVDGKFSVSCYLDALSSAFEEWSTLERERGRGEALVRCAYHVPYVKMAKKADARRALVEGLTVEAAEERFRREVGSSLVFAGEVGNIYTGSLYMAVASMLHHEARDLEGRRVGLFSYGSGCAAEFFAATVAAGAGRLARRLELDRPLRDRVRLSISEYESIRRAEGEGDPVAQESHTVAGASTVFVGVDAVERRVYQRAARGSSPLEGRSAA